MVRVFLALAYLLAGCATVFDLEEVPDAPPPPMGVDHDGDGIFAGDVCPAVPDPDQLDDDKDGIGNACDPHLDQRDEVVVQELLDDENIGGWIAAGTWDRKPGAWTSPPAFDGSTEFYYTLPRELYRPSLQVGFTILEYSTINELRELAAHLDAPASEGDCSFRYNPTLSGAKSQLVLHVTGGPDGGSVADWVFGTRYLGTYTRALTSECVVNGQRRETPDVVEQFSTAPVLLIRRMQVILHHVTLYQVIP